MVLIGDILLFIFPPVRRAESTKCTCVFCVPVFIQASRHSSCNKIETTASLWQARRFAAVLSLPYLNMSYVSEEEGMVTVHEPGDLHPVTLAILMSINVTDNEYVVRT